MNWRWRRTTMRRRPMRRASRPPPRPSLFLRKENLLPEIGLINESIWIEDKSRSADQSLLYKELIKEIKSLPPTYRIVFNMFVIDGFSHQDIARHLKIAIGTSKSNLSKARGLLQIIIKKAEQEKICYI